MADEDCDDAAVERVVWDLTPYWEVEPERVGVVAFLEAWRDAMGGASQSHDPWFLENEPSRHPLTSLVPWLYPTAHQVRVITGVVAWLGFPLGRCFLDECESRRKRGSFPKDKTSLLVWTLQRRDNSPMARFQVPDGKLTYEDLCLIEHVMAWLDTEAGLRFTRGCEESLREASRAEEDARLAGLRRSVAS